MRGASLSWLDFQFALHAMKFAISSTTFINNTALILPRRTWYGILIAGFLPAAVFGQTAFTWQQIKDKFEAANPDRKSTRLNSSH